MEPIQINEVAERSHLEIITQELSALAEEMAAAAASDWKPLTIGAIIGAAVVGCTMMIID